MLICRTIMPPSADAEWINKVTNEIKKLNPREVDRIEFRADGIWQENLSEKDAIDALKLIKKTAGEIPVLFTLRSIAQGGFYVGGKEQYRKVLHLAASETQMDLIDVEVSEEENREDIIEYIHQNGKEVISSAHIFSGTFSKDECERTMELLKKTSGDILKIAVLVNSADEAEMLRTLIIEDEEWMARKHIVIAMGEYGKVSRYDENWAGSCMTFVAGDQKVAPGQLTLEEYIKIPNLQILTKTIDND